MRRLLVGQLHGGYTRVLFWYCLLLLTVCCVYEYSLLYLRSLWQRRDGYQFILVLLQFVWNGSGNFRTQYNKRYLHRQ